ncbi:MAG TPA: FMN-binding negative transcriptional regulator [Chthonomonadaceae bacterium]|nr:FMN-binding negative transcriptional regulator [Chthonomonadaceae bacterium]
MYIPAHFHEDDLVLLHEMMRAYNFGTLVTCQDRVPFATHLPFHLDAERGAYGTLRAHLARANPQWRSFPSEEEVLALFQGPHAYISPSWYEMHPSVPTWNYIAIHAYGVPRLLDEAALRAALADLVHTHEAPLEPPWRFEDLPEEYVQKMLRGIVGFEIEITRLEGKFKLSQNRSEADRRSVAERLRQTGDAQLAALADLMSHTGAE